MIKKIIKGTLDKLGYKITKKKVDQDLLLIHLLDLFELERLDERFAFLKKSLLYFEELKVKKQAKFIFEENNFFVEIDNLKFKINSNEEILILYEVFVEGIYNCLTSNNFSVIDIGMNVGITSLFFANMKNCKSVYSYEPFDYTYNLAIENMNLNNCSHKINKFHFGVGYPERTLKIQFSKEYKGSVGVNGLAEYIYNSNEILSEAEIQIKDVSKSFENNFNDFDGDFIVKIDCEGAEYEIIERLEETNNLKKGKIYLVEWHLKGPKDLVEIFNRNEFYVVSFNEKNNNIGMLYAFNTQKD